MATNAYPKIGVKTWATLRARAATAPSTKFTPETVAALMEMGNPKSARDNTVSPMRRLGLIDEDGALTDRGNKWRVDSSFGDACQEILDEFYPDELGSLTNEDGSPDADKVKNWFGHKGFGNSNARKMAATYVMVASKRLPEPPAAGSDKPKKKASTKTDDSGKPSQAKKAEVPLEKEAQESSAATVSPNGGPTVHLDIQIHIPADATPGQIDQIFSSMARHLYAK
ncbi:MAG: hypothetical protein OXI18_05760 [bacterium]|nr:hypothetical protein [bacterium]